LSALLACAALLATACGGDNTQTRDSDTDPAAESNVKKGVQPVADEMAAVIDVQDFGQIVIELYPNIAPQMVERFKTLAQTHVYDGTTFHRVEPPTAAQPGGVIQGGDPNSKDDNYENDGMGQSDLPDLPAEFSDVPYELGTVGAARSGDPNSANSQFFISLGRNQMWDTRYTVFGRVIRGMSVARDISNAPPRPGTTNPDPKVVIKSVTLQPRANFQ
jgi:peptidylprolyl isomerase